MSHTRMLVLCCACLLARDEPDLVVTRADRRVTIDAKDDLWTVTSIQMGTTLWSRSMPHSVISASLSERGHVCGLGLSMDHADDYPGWLHLFILAPDGANTLDNQQRRSISRYVSASPDPHMAAVLTTASRAIFRVQEIAQLGTQVSERWLAYDLDTGDKLAEFRPADRFKRYPKTSVVTAISIAGTDCVLVEWFSEPFSERGLVVALFSPTFEPVWSLQLPRDYLMRDPATQSDAYQFVVRSGTISSPDATPHFEVYEIKSQQIHRFRIVEGRAKTSSVIHIETRRAAQSEHWQTRLRSMNPRAYRSPEARIPIVPRSRHNVPDSQPTSTSRPR